MFGNPETTSGGRALKFFSSMRIDVRRIESIKEGDKILGNRTRAKIVKNKVAPPFKQAEFDIMFAEGISKAGGVLDTAVEHDIIKKAGSWFSYEGDRLGQGRENVKKILIDNPALMAEVEEKVRNAVFGDKKETETIEEKASEPEFVIDDDGVIIE